MRKLENLIQEEKGRIRSLWSLEFWDKFLCFRIRPLYPKHVKIDDLLNGLDVLSEISNFTPTLGFTGIPHLEESVCH